MALLGLLGLVALLLPLSQVLRFQVDALDEARAERARLDPMAEAVALQRGLLDHDEVATRVLRGRVALEGERRQRQAEVDRRLASLNGMLWAGQWQRARREAAGLQTDWRRLVDDIQARRVDAITSQQRHRLLQEQVVQVMDFVQAGLTWPLGRPELKEMEARIEVRLLEIRGQESRARHAMSLLVVSLVTAALWLLAGLWAAWRSAGPKAAVSTDAGAVRRTHGRRAGDRAAVTRPGDIAAIELQALRRAAEDERSGS